MHAQMLQCSYKIQIQNTIRLEGHATPPCFRMHISSSVLSPVLRVAMLELQENINYLQCFAITKAWLFPAGLLIQKEMQVTSTVLIEVIAEV